MVTIKLLVKHEETIGRLYEACAARFPELKTFWPTLAYEEADHAKKYANSSVILPRQLLTIIKLLNRHGLSTGDIHRLGIIPLDGFDKYLAIF